MPDMSGTFRREIDTSVKRARKLLEAGDLQGAKNAYLKASEMALKYAKSAPTSEIKNQRLERANALKTKADAVLKQRVRDGQDAGGAAVSAEGDEVDADREQVRRLIARSDVTWEDIAGLEGVKRELRTTYAMAVARLPEGVKLSPPRTILLYGPPGTGKTLLAKAVSASLEATFFSIRTGDLLSSLFGKSPQMIATLYEEAAARAPSVVFFDEIESLTPSRDGEISPAESRVVTAFLQSLGGFTSEPDAPFVLTIGATNVPWKLDDALLSRFGRKVHVPLPDRDCRERIFQLNLDENGIETETGASGLAEITDGYSGRDITKLCEQAVSAAIHEHNPSLSEVVSQGLGALQQYELQLGCISAAHFREAMSKLKPVTDDEALENYSQWASRQGG